MKKAVVTTGGKQYIVAEGDLLSVELIGTVAGKVYFEPLLVIDGEDVAVGTPLLSNRKVVAVVVEGEAKSDKVTAIRYKAKKRVHKLRGHRQRQTTLKIASIV